MLMDKKLKAYIEYIDKESKHPSAELIAFHRDQVQQFQHERFIHLIVTMRLFYLLSPCSMYDIITNLKMARKSSRITRAN